MRRSKNLLHRSKSRHQKRMTMMMVLSILPRSPSLKRKRKKKRRRRRIKSPSLIRLVKLARSKRLSKLKRKKKGRRQRTVLILTMFQATNNLSTLTFSSAFKKSAKLGIPQTTGRFKPRSSNHRLQRLPSNLLGSISTIRSKQLLGSIAMCLNSSCPSWVARELLVPLRR